MANFKDKFSGTTIKGGKFTALSASIVAAAGNVVDGKKFDILSGSDAISKLPYRITRGDQAKFFPGLKEGTSNGRIETSSIFRDTVTKIVYVPIKKKNFQENLIGVNSHISTSFSSSAYLQCSAAFAELYSGVSGDTIFTYAVEEFYSSPSASRTSAFVGEVTASFNVFASGTLTSSFSAIDLVGYAEQTDKRTPNFTFNFPASNYITHFRLKNGISGSLENVDIQFGGGNGGNGLNFSASVLTDNQFVGPASGTIVPSISQLVNVNGANVNAGKYVSHTSKVKLGGDSDSGSLYDIESQIVGTLQIAVYPRGQEGLIDSGNFQYHASDRNLATGSSDIKTLYFISGSDQNTDYGFFVTSSTLTVNTAGALVHKDIDLRTRADEGFYSPSGSQYTSSIQVNRASGVSFGPHIAHRYQTGN